MINELVGMEISPFGTVAPLTINSCIPDFVPITSIDGYANISISRCLANQCYHLNQCLLRNIAKQGHQKFREVSIKVQKLDEEVERKLGEASEDGSSLDAMNQIVLEHIKKLRELEKS